MSTKNLYVCDHCGTESESGEGWRCLTVVELTDTVKLTGIVTCCAHACPVCVRFFDEDDAGMLSFVKRAWLGLRAPRSFQPGRENGCSNCRRRTKTFPFHCSSHPHPSRPRLRRGACEDEREAGA